MAGAALKLVVGTLLCSWCCASGTGVHLETGHVDAASVETEHTEYSSDTAVLSTRPGGSKKYHASATLDRTETLGLLNSRLRRSYGPELVGKRLSMFCHEWNEWYTVDVLWYHPENGTHVLKYTYDSFIEVVNLSEYQVSAIEPNSDSTHGVPELPADAPPQTLADEVGAGVSSIISYFFSREKSDL